MKIATLPFACVVLLNFARVGAMNNSSGYNSSRGGYFERQQSTERRVRSSDVPSPQPDTSAWTSHAHTHPPYIQNALFDANRLQNMILLSSFVENGGTTNWLFLKADLVANSNIASCNGPYGYAVVDLSGSERLYGCLRPDSYHKDSAGARHNGFVPVFLATVVREGRYRFEGQLSSSGAKSTLNSPGSRYRGGDGMKSPGSQPVGHVRYVKSGPINPIDVEGDLYQYP